MNETIREMIEEIEALKSRLGEEIARQEEEISYKIRDGYVRFEKDVLDEQRENMKHLLAWFREVPLLHLLSSPVVYAMIIPALLLDIMLLVYQFVVTRVFKLKFGKRSDYIVFDRQYLGYLNIIEKFNCMYCSYFNGLMHYAAMIAGRTELYFCPVKHAKKIAYKHDHYELFLTYGDGKGYQKKLKELRENVAKEEDSTKKS